MTLQEHKGYEVLKVQGVDASGGPFDVFKQISINGKVAKSQILSAKES